MSAVAYGVMTPGGLVELAPSLEKARAWRDGVKPGTVSYLPCKVVERPEGRSYWSVVDEPPRNEDESATLSDDGTESRQDDEGLAGRPALV